MNFGDITKDIIILVSFLIISVNKSVFIVKISCGLLENDAWVSARLSNDCNMALLSSCLFGTPLTVVSLIVF